MGHERLGNSLFEFVGVLMSKRKLIVGFLLMGFYSKVFAAGISSDPQTHALLTTSNKLSIKSIGETVKALQEAKRQTEQAIEMRKQLMGMKNTIGQFKGTATSLKSDLLKWETYYTGIDTLDVDNFSAFNWLGLDSLDSSTYAPNTSNAIGSFNSDKAFKDVKQKIFEDENHPEEMKYRRQELAHNSIATGVVISNQSKNTLTDSKEQITKVTQQAIYAQDLLEAMNAQNKLLAIIASEMVQQRELSAQQVEMLASFFARFEGTSKLTEPSKRSAAKKPWE